MLRLSMYLLCLLSVSSTALSKSYPFFTKDHATTSSSGNLLYEIPIQMFPGVGDLKPSLSLKYSVQNVRASELGPSWSINGLSQIQRCPQIQRIHGSFRPVRMDKQDALCLDGQHLVKTNGIHFENGATYKTEIDGHARIEITEANEHEAIRFLITLASGRRMFYEASERLEKSDSDRTWSWKLSRVEDRFGNQINYEYVNDPESIQTYLASISYSVNRIEFQYKTNENPLPQFLKGADYKTSYLLDGIKHYVKETPVKEATLTYSRSHWSKRPYLSSFQECMMPDNCKVPLRFKMEKAPPETHAQDTEVWHDSFVTSKGWTTSHHPRHVVDVNGDGLSDILGFWNQGVMVALNNGHSFTAPKLWLKAFGRKTGGWGPENLRYLKDMNSDGLLDILGLSSKGVLVSLGTGSSFGKPDVWAKGFGYRDGYRVGSHNRFVIDLNHDGRPDFIAFGQRSVRVSLNTGHSLSKAEIWSRDFVGSKGWLKQQRPLNVVDMNADGFPDIVGFSNNGVLVALGTGTSFEKATHWTKDFRTGRHYDKDKELRKIVDINKDGLPDVVFINRHRIHIGFNTGTRFEDSIELDSDFSFSDGRWTNRKNIRDIADMNGDGFPDIVGFGGTEVQVSFGNGSSFTPRETWTQGFGSSLGWSFGKHLRFITDVDGDYLPDIVGFSDSSVQVARTSHSTPRLRSVSQGTFRARDFSYTSLKRTNTDIKPTVYPVATCLAQIPIIQSMTSRLSHVKSRTQTFRFKDHKCDFQNQSRLGFTKVSMTENETGLKRTQTFSQNLNDRLVGKLLEEKTVTSQNIPIAYKQYLWDSKQWGNSYQITLASLDEERFSLRGQPMTRTTSAMSYDIYGNQTETKTAYFSYDEDIQDFTLHLNTTEISTYDEDLVSRHILNRKTSLRSVRKKTGFRRVERVTSYNYDHNGVLIDEESDPHTRFFLKHSYKYDSWGNRIETRTNWPYTRGDGLSHSERINRSEYDPDGRFLVKTINTMGHTENYTYDDLGRITRKTDVDQLTTSYSYNPWGHLVSKSEPTGLITNYNVSWALDEDHGWRKEVQERNDGFQEVLFFDRRNNLVRRETPLGNGKSSIVESKYDVFDQKVATSRPFIEGHDVYWQNYAFDSLGRALNRYSITGEKIELSYDGFSVTERNADGLETIIRKDFQGRTISVTDPLGTKTTFTYGPKGLLSEIDKGDAGITAITYDLQGQKKTLNDPATGNIRFFFNRFGKLVWKEDASGNRTTHTYDALDRLLKRKLTSSDSEQSAISYSWFYDDPRHVSRVSKIEGPLSKRFSYTNDGLLDTTDIWEDATQTFSFQKTYDEMGRIKAMTYPGGKSFVHLYSDSGRLEATQDAETLQILWMVDDWDVSGKPSLVSYGNGTTLYREFDAQTSMPTSISISKSDDTLVSQTYHYQDRNLLSSRSTTFRNKGIRWEYFFYDALGRLNSSEIHSPEHFHLTDVSYDRFGNILSKSDVGQFSYENSNRLSKINGSPDIKIFHDASGNIREYGEYSASYYADNRIRSLTHPSNGEHTFFYGPHGQKYRSLIEQENGKNIATLNLDGLYDRIVKDGKTVERIHVGNFGYLTIQNQTSTFRYLHKDALGSVILITDKNGEPVDQKSYDAWGSREPFKTQDTDDKHTETNLNSFINKDKLPGTPFVFMGGRLYDSSTGRFLSPDPVVQNQYNLQHHNRYSYALNNPLLYKDPSGHFGFLGFLIGAAVSAFTGSVTAAAIAGSVSALTTAVITGVVAGASFGASYTAVSGGSLSDILNAGFMGALTGGLGGAVFGGVSQVFQHQWSFARVVTHAAAGGGMSSALGGDFGKGALLSGITATAAWGLNYMQRQTDNLYIKSREATQLPAKYTKQGQLATFGERAKVGDHFDLEGTPSERWGSWAKPFDEYAVRISKSHDFLRSQVGAYRFDGTGITGSAFGPSALGRLVDSGHNVSTMLPAWMHVSIADSIGKSWAYAGVIEE